MLFILGALSAPSYSIHNYLVLLSRMHCTILDVSCKGKMVEMH